ncbi:hypothetical protein [Aquamicrobium defluvii]|uniref:hypothetical protein n=1 Tax=Aquamicrobium defluvii TaxID=69279 RepID=UPI001AACA966|nr:hypothetical protein [Aquamicrobium defluvii]
MRQNPVCGSVVASSDRISSLVRRRPLPMASARCQNAHSFCMVVSPRPFGRFVDDFCDEFASAAEAVSGLQFAKDCSGPVAKMTVRQDVVIDRARSD